MLDTLNQSLDLIINQTKANGRILAEILALVWGVYGINLLLGRRLLWLGIIPRRWYGVMGIACAPLLHAHYNHLFFNSIPLVVLSNFILISGFAYFLKVSVLITVISGGLLWVFGQPGVHVGASALITGYWSLLVSDIVQQASVTAIILGVISVYYFAGIFLGIFPSKKGVSWDGHLFGLLAGIATSYWMI